MHLPVALTAVSGAVQRILSQEFGRTSIIIPNSVDCERFRPGPLSSHPYTAVLMAPVSQVRHNLVGQGHSMTLSKMSLITYKFVKSCVACRVAEVIFAL